MIDSHIVESQHYNHDADVYINKHIIQSWSSTWARWVWLESGVSFNAFGWYWCQKTDEILPCAMSSFSYSDRYGAESANVLPSQGCGSPVVAYTFQSGITLMASRTALIIWWTCIDNSFEWFGTQHSVTLVMRCLGVSTALILLLRPKNSFISEELYVYVI